MFKKLIIIYFFIYPILVLGFIVKGSIPGEYLRGVDRAQNLARLKQDRPLFNIDSSNSLVEVACRPEWNCKPGGSWEEKGKFKENVRVKVVTLVSEVTNMYNEYMGNERKYALGGRLIWVTPSPELKNFCRNIVDRSQLKLELEKYLGLPPDSTKERVVTLWVEPDDIFRPCYSPDITSTSCPTSYPPNVPLEHKNWLDKTFRMSYPPPGQSMAYPFTRMGFAYFWGNPKTIQGASEYLVKANSEMFVEKVETIEEYCR